MNLTRHTPATIPPLRSLNSHPSTLNQRRPALPVPSLDSGLWTLDSSAPRLKARHPFAYDSQNAPCGSQGCISERDVTDVSGNVNLAKADDVEVGQRPMPPRTTPAEFTFPLTRRVRRPHLLTKGTRASVPPCPAPPPPPPPKSAAPHLLAVK